VSAPANRVLDDLERQRLAALRIEGSQVTLTIANVEIGELDAEPVESSRCVDLDDRGA